MGHIALAAPVSHIWYFKGIPSRMGLILDLSPRTLEKVLYFASYIVLDKRGETEMLLQTGSFRKEYQDARETWGNGFPCREWEQKLSKSFLKQSILKKKLLNCRQDLKGATGQKKCKNR